MSDTGQRYRCPCFIHLSMGGRMDREEFAKVVEEEQLKDV